MQHALANLPKGLKQLIGAANLVQNTMGCSKALVFHLPQLKGYLKIAKFNPTEPLAYEAEVLHWLQGKLPVPKVLYFEHLGDYEYLLISEVEGQDCSQAAHRHEPKAMVYCLAEGLRLIHGLDITDCPFDQTIPVKLKKARSNVEQGLVDETDFEPAYQGLRARDLLALLEARRPAQESRAFTHGDYCLPNIILNQGKVSGFIDLGRAGVSDPYVDIALAVRSLRHNYGSEQLVELFLLAYGLDAVDKTKMEFYTLLDELL